MSSRSVGQNADPRAVRAGYIRKTRKPAAMATAGRPIWAVARWVACSASAPMRLLSNLNRISDRAAERGVRAVLHPHVGTMVENGDEVQRVLSGSSISLCLDTGHLLIGGTDPADLTRQAPDRIAHTHLKDVDSQIADKVRAGRLSYTEAVVRGMYRPLGTGDVDVETIVNTLQANGYTGWYTLEQDTVLTEEPRGEGPVTDVRTSATYVTRLLAPSVAPAEG